MTQSTIMESQRDEFHCQVDQLLRRGPNSSWTKTIVPRFCWLLLGLCICPSDLGFATCVRLFASRIIGEASKQTKRKPSGMHDFRQHVRRHPFLTVGTGVSSLDRESGCILIPTTHIFDEEVRFFIGKPTFGMFSPNRESSNGYGERWTLI